MRLLLLLRTLFCYALCGVAALLFIVPCFLIACLPARYRYNNRVFFRILDLFYTTVTYSSLNPVTIRGRENLPTTEAIFIANHQSSFDIPVVGSLCNGYPHVWLVLSYYVSMPVLGFFITRMFVPVDRDNPVKAAGSLRTVLKFIQEKKVHLIIFPEGMRHTDGRIHEFYEGFALIARKTGRPVIPVYIPTTGTIYPRYSFYIYSSPLDIIIGKPMFIVEDETEEAFTHRVRDWYLSEYKKYIS